MGWGGGRDQPIQNTPKKQAPREVNDMAQVKRLLLVDEDDWFLLEVIANETATTRQAILRNLIEGFITENRDVVMDAMAMGGGVWVE